MWGDGRLNEVLIWNKVLESLKSQLASLNYDIWFKNTEPVEVHASYNDVFENYGFYLLKYSDGKLYTNCIPDKNHFQGICVLPDNTFICGEICGF